MRQTFCYWNDAQTHDEHASSFYADSKAYKRESLFKLPLRKEDSLSVWQVSSKSFRNEQEALVRSWYNKWPLSTRWISLLCCFEFLGALMDVRLKRRWIGWGNIFWFFFDWVKTVKKEEPELLLMMKRLAIWLELFLPMWKSNFSSSKENKWKEIYIFFWPLNLILSPHS